ncbi:DUF3052 domain-containing protein [Streptomyces pseudovenezuelae]|uniref:DUF3052 domain-containing protein n=1 Tax=Streptomyces pseudovenezuelae TaxID=67350 RepID=A0ABT6LE83_9ACTN|nr:DUF3052 domain-containing protein [Streptomyces pseudovenezuelae]MDH6214621.1 hypothetical protein [Streptomyces pseudovenezuelae]
MAEHSDSATNSGYSGTPLAKKIGVKPGHRVRLLHAPDSFDIPGLPDDVDLTPAAPASAPDITLAFYRTHATLTAEATTLVAELTDSAMLWIAWPRKAAGHVSDIAENDLRDLFLPLGIVDVKVAALGEDWSGLKFVRRKENRGAATANRRDTTANRRGTNTSPRGTGTNRRGTERNPGY